MQPPSSPASNRVTAESLAEEIGVHPERIFALIDHGYLTCIVRSDFPDLTLVERPDDETLGWLAAMLRPLPRRPLLPCSVASQALGVSPNVFRDLCIDHAIQFYLDPLFGNLITLENYAELARSVRSKRYPAGTDRQSLLEVFMSLFGLAKRARFAPPRRDAQIRAEISRISRLPEPERTIAAAAFWSSYEEARDVAECIAAFHEAPLPQKLRNLDVRALRLNRRLEGKAEWRYIAKGDLAARRQRSGFRSKFTPEQEARYTAMVAQCDEIKRKVVFELRAEIDSRSSRKLRGASSPASTPNDPSASPSSTPEQ